MPSSRNVEIKRDAKDNVIITGDGNLVILQATRSVDDVSPVTNSDFGRNPYRGLEVFREEHAHLFFGREALVAKVWTHFRSLHEPRLDGRRALRLLPIIGPSGSGKSSLARAGLIAELARRPLPDRAEARVGVITPGTHPTESLALILARIATGEVAPISKTVEMAKRLRQVSPMGAFDGLRFVADLLPEIATKPIIILIDQFEEVYSLCQDSNEQDAFVATILHAASDTGSRVSIILTLRSDFLGATNKHPDLSHALAENAILVPVMNDEELRRAIEQPAIDANHPIDQATVELLVTETAGREGALPLMQFALTRIWEGMAEGVPPAQTLRKLRGVGGALANEAQRIYESLSLMDQRIARRAFLAMVQLGEGTLDTRRRATLPEIVGKASLKFSRDGNRLLALRSDGLADLWVDLNEKAITLDGHRNSILSGSFSQDGQRIVTASADHSARIWNAATGMSTVVLEGHRSPVNSAQFSTDGRRVVTASQDHTARVWDAQTGRMLLEMKGHEGPVSFATFSPNDRVVVTASDDSSAALWDAASGERRSVLRGHRQNVAFALFSSDGRVVVTVSDAIRLWNAENGNLITVLPLDSFDTFASFSRDGMKLVTAESSFAKFVRLWDVGTTESVGTFAGYHGVELDDENGQLYLVSGDRAEIWSLLPGGQALIDYARAILPTQ